MKTFISLGAGVQSSTMALMFAKGEIGPMPDGAIFADTQAEPQAVYDWLEWLETQLPFPVIRVTNGDLMMMMMSSVQGGRFAGIPFFTESANGKGMLKRQCTSEFKIKPIEKELRRQVGLVKGQRGPKEPIVTSCIGISIDEVMRQKPSRVRWIAHRWPLLEKRMSRIDCLQWMDRNGYQKPPRSACVFCPYKHDREWLALKETPDEWAKAVLMDETARNGVRGTKEKLYLHSSLRPLTEALLDASAQGDMFNEDCEGMCGV